MPRLIGATYLRDYKIRIELSDGNTGEIDLRNKLTGPIFKPLEDINEFAKVKYDPELETIIWPNGADLAPEFLLQQLNN